ncbi:exo-alpha-sialidase [candidate division WOR-3 bacterium]|nr:exo-alpha-sialidase [candidate division WOR-3 bacterium]
MFLAFLTLVTFAQTNFENIRVNSDTDPALPFHNEEQIVVNPKDSLNLVACWRDFRLGYRQVGIGVSFDGGLTWEDRLISNSGYTYDSDPGLTTDGDGNIYLVTLAFDDGDGENALAVFKSTDGGLTFGSPNYAALGDNTVFHDKELIACDRGNSPYKGNLYVTWTLLPDEDRGRIYCTSSADGGGTWTEPVAISDLLPDGSVQWSVPCVGSDGTVYAAWVNLDENAIMLDRSYDGGITWGEDQLVLYAPGFYYIDDWIGVFSFPAMDADITNGPYGGNLYMAYLSYTGSDTDSDIYFIRSEDGGDTWSEQVKISGDDVPENDQFHPWLVVDNLGIIHVVFYDQRNGLEDDLQDVYYTKSEDGGDSWSEPERVSAVASRPSTTKPPYLSPEPMPGEIYGEYVGLAAWNGRPFPVWTDCRENGVQNIYFGWYNPTVIIEKPEIVSKGVEARFVPAGVKVSFDSPITGSCRFKLFDATGRSVYSSSVILSQTREMLLDVGKVPNGIYFLEIVADGETRTTKIAKIK